jgi:hypothetical protein
MRVPVATDDGILTFRQPGRSWPSLIFDADGSEIKEREMRTCTHGAHVRGEVTKTGTRVSLLAMSRSSSLSGIVKQRIAAGTKPGEGGRGRRGVREIARNDALPGFRVPGGARLSPFLSLWSRLGWKI